MVSRRKKSCLVTRQVPLNNTNRQHLVGILAGALGGATIAEQLVEQISRVSALRIDKVLVMRAT
jgi:hypothetical protein